jgi:IclR helix-turn-helix domain
VSSKRDTDESGEEVPLALTAEQVVRVIEEAVSAGAAGSRLLSGLGKPRELVSSPLLEDRRVSRSLLCGLVVLVSFPADGSERGVKAIAGELGLAASTTHRYIHTLLAVGLLAQDPVTRKYRRAHPPGGRRGRRRET